MERLARSVVAFLMLLAVGYCAQVAAQEAAPAVTSAECSGCHEGTGGQPAEVTPDSLAGSMHEGFECLDCHAGITELPHADSLAPVDCGTCHADVAALYTHHGMGQVGVDARVPTCAHCHGTHAIRSVSDEASAVHPKNLPATCGSCHEDEKFTTEQNIRFKHPVRVYSTSVHGRATEGGMSAAASCNDCHSTGGSAHRILPPGDVASPINHFNIASTCGQCHPDIKRDYNEGIHGQLTARGQVQSPICTTCHGEHNILPVHDPRSPVSSSRLAEATCSPCHESAFLNEKYELPTGRLQSFQDSYHGLKSKAGDATVANCASCHGTHRILPASDPTSTIHPENLKTTCGGCHPGISAEIAQTPIHANTSGLHTGAAGVVQKIYVIAIILIIGSMVVHWLIDLRRQLSKVILERDSVRRMEPDEVVQHFVLAISFTVLVITGFSLRFYDAWWSEWIFGWEGGFTFRGIVHRVAGVILLLASVWHLVFLMTARGRRFLRDMWPGMGDVRAFWDMTLYNLGRRHQHPHFGRFSYVEKAEYWALVWGTIVMGVTGLLLWFDNALVNWLPKGLLDVMLVIHYYEAWLAFLAILIWHMYSTVFSPKVYPMNPSWLTGYMPRKQFEAEHPLLAGAGKGDDPGQHGDTRPDRPARQDH